MLLDNRPVVFTDSEIAIYTLLQIEKALNSGNRSLVEFPNLPQLDLSIISTRLNRLIAAERSYNIAEEQRRFSNLFDGLNTQQKEVFDNIMDAVDTKRGGGFFWVRLSF